MKTKRYFMGILLAVACSMQMFAQTLEDGEAFYIYRNDGDFNGFFYDQVKDMRYSKVDLEGVEYDEFVVQEIETADSIYRIPLCAIDSIGFVQPAVEMQPNVVILEDHDMIKYITSLINVSKNSYKLTLGNDINEDLVPKVGDVIISTTYTDYYGEGFAFKATKVNKRGGISSTWYELEGDVITSMGEVFKRLVSTEYITADKDGQPMRRVAGLDRIVGDAGSASFNLLNLSGTLTREYDSNLAITIDYGVRVGIQVTYDITVDHLFVKLGMEEDLSAQAGFSGSLSGTWEPEFSLLPDWIGAIKFPACLPLFETNALPKTFFRISGSVGIKSTLPSVNFKAKQLVIISDRTGSWLNCSATSNFFTGYGENDNLFQPGDSRLTFNAFAQTGIKFDNTIKTNGWARSIFQSSIGLETYVGPKLQGSIDISLPELAKGDLSYSTLRNMSISISPCTADIEAKARVNILDYPSKSVKFGEASYSYGEVKRNLIASIEDFKVVNDEEDDHKVTFQSKWKGDVLFGHDLGVVIYKKDKTKPDAIGEEVMRDMTYHYSGEKDLEYTATLPSGCFIAMPVVRLMNGDIQVMSERKLLDIPPKFNLSVSKLELRSHGETLKDSVVSVISYSADIPVEAYTSYLRLGGYSETRVIHNRDAKTFTLITSPNPNISPRTDTLTVYYKSLDSNNYSTVKIPVVQAGGDYKIKSVTLLGATGFCHYSSNTYHKTNGNVVIDKKISRESDETITSWNPTNTYDYELPCQVSQKGDKYTITASREIKRGDIVVNYSLNLEMTLGNGKIRTDNFFFKKEFKDVHTIYQDGGSYNESETSIVTTNSPFEEMNGTCSYNAEYGYGSINFKVPRYECTSFERHYLKDVQYAKQDTSVKDTEDISGLEEHDPDMMSVSLNFNIESK